LTRKLSVFRAGFSCAVNHHTLHCGCSMKAACAGSKHCLTAPAVGTHAAWQSRVHRQWRHRQRPVIVPCHAVACHRRRQPRFKRNVRTPTKTDAAPADGGDILLENSRGTSETLSRNQPRNTIEDESFEHLPQLFSDVGDKPGACSTHRKRRRSAR
jgi:hypothetical protein